MVFWVISTNVCLSVNFYQEKFYSLGSCIYGTSYACSQELEEVEMVYHLWMEKNVTSAKTSVVYMSSMSIVQPVEMKERCAVTITLSLELTVCDCDQQLV